MKNMLFPFHIFVMQIIWNKITEQNKNIKNRMVLLNLIYFNFTAIGTTFQ